MSLNSATLFQDIIYLIVEYLYYDDHDSVHDCCLVSRSWVAPCQKHIFSAITLTTPMLIMRFRRSVDGTLTEHPSEGLYKSFLENPRLVTYVRSLTVVYLGNTFSYFSSLLELFIAQDTLRHVSIQAKISDIQSSAGHLLLALARLQCLRSIQINIRASCACAFPLDFLDTVSSSIRHISIVSPSSCDHDGSRRPTSLPSEVVVDRPEAQPLNVIEVQGASLGDVAAYFDGMHGLFHLRHLRSIILRGLPEKDAPLLLHSLQRMLTNSRTLKTLVLHDIWCGHLGEIIQLRNFPYLRTILISVPLAKGRQTLSRFLSQFPAYLTRLFIVLKQLDAWYDRKILGRAVGRLVSQLCAIYRGCCRPPFINVQLDIGESDSSGWMDDVNTWFSPLMTISDGGCVVGFQGKEEEVEHLVQSIVQGNS